MNNELIKLMSWRISQQIFLPLFFFSHRNALQDDDELRHLSLQRFFEIVMLLNLVDDYLPNGEHLCQLAMLNVARLRAWASVFVS